MHLVLLSIHRPKYSETYYTISIWRNSMDKCPVLTRICLDLTLSLKSIQAKNKCLVRAVITKSCDHQKITSKLFYPYPTCFCFICLPFYSCYINTFLFVIACNATGFKNLKRYISYMNVPLKIRIHSSFHWKNIRMVKLFYRLKWEGHGSIKQNDGNNVMIGLTIP